MARSNKPPMKVSVGNGVQAGFTSGCFPMIVTPFVITFLTVLVVLGFPGFSPLPDLTPLVAFIAFVGPLDRILITGLTCGAACALVSGCACWIINRLKDRSAQELMRNFAAIVASAIAAIGFGSVLFAAPGDISQSANGGSYTFEFPAWIVVALSIVVGVIAFIVVRDSIRELRSSED